MKLPVAFTLGNREASLDKDSLMRNAMAEVDKDEGVVRAKKRPCIDSAFTATSGLGQALFVWNIPGALAPTQTLVAITASTAGTSIINTAPTPINKKLSFTVQPT